jgi:hypothetical protein
MQCPGCSFLLRDADFVDLNASLERVYVAVIVWTSLGILYTMFCLFLGRDFGGGGHGWMIPFAAGITTLLTGPMTGVAWALRRTTTGWRIALCLVIFVLLIDLGIVAVELRNSGTVWGGWEIAHYAMIIWAVIFASHQLVAGAVVLLHKRFNQSPTN